MSAMQVTVLHHITKRSASVMEFDPGALTMMAQGAEGMVGKHD